MTIVPSFEPGDELRAEAEAEDGRRDGDGADEDEGRPREAKPEVEERLEEPVGHAGRRTSPCPDVFRESPSEARTGMSVSDRTIDADEGEDDRQGHRPEELPLDPLEGEDRQVDNHDDQLAEHRRLAHLDGRVADDVELRPVRAVVGEVPHAVLDHDDRAIDDEPEVDGPEAHQAPGDADPLHHRDGEEHRERDGRGHDQPGPEVPEEGEEHGDDEDGPLEEVPLDGLQAPGSTRCGPLVDDRRRRRPAGGPSSRRPSPCRGPSSRRASSRPSA